MTVDRGPSKIKNKKIIDLKQMRSANGHPQREVRHLIDMLNANRTSSEMRHCALAPGDTWLSCQKQMLIRVSHKNNKTEPDVETLNRGSTC